jgi:hypothetical protein
MSRLRGSVLLEILDIFGNFEKKIILKFFERLENFGKINENLIFFFKFGNFWKIWKILENLEMLTFLSTRHHGAHEGIIFSCIIPS